jgi:glutamate/tyrosine decarboxylase-like PLP-dependent enzyme
MTKTNQMRLHQRSPEGRGLRPASGHVLGVEAVAVPTAADGTMDLQALEETLRGGRIGTVVATPGTTGLGAVDPVHEILALCRRYGARVHVDAAYGGFFRLIADGTAEG